MKRLLRALLVWVALLLVLMLAAPGLLYLAGLASVHGRPVPTVEPLSVERQNWLRCELRAGDRDQPVVNNPWKLALGYMKGEPFTSYGDRLAWLVARDYRAGHLLHARGLTEDVSGVALTIWVARHWTLPEMEARAHRLLQQSRVFHCPPASDEWPPSSS